MKKYINKNITITGLFILTLNVFCTSLKAQVFIDGVIDSVVVTPVNLTTFTANKIEKNVQLTWTTATEKNNSHFLVQRSIDGTNFENIARIYGSLNSSSVTNYSYKDIDVPNTNLYYRLQQVDLNGKATLSNTILIKDNKAISIALSIFPNPIIDNNINISIKNVASGDYKIALRNILGETIFQKSINLTGSYSSTSIQLPKNTTKGILFINLISADGKTNLSEKIIVQ